MKRKARWQEGEADSHTASSVGKQGEGRWHSAGVLLFVQSRSPFLGLLLLTFGGGGRLPTPINPAYKLPYSHVQRSVS